MTAPARTVDAILASFPPGSVTELSAVDVAVLVAEVERLRGLAPTVTLDTVRSDLEQIAANADDFEVAHSLEDQLHQEVLQAIAEGSCQDPAKCALMALTSADIEFLRTCA